MDRVLAQIAAHVQARPNDECLAEGDTRLSFAEVDAITDNLAAELIAAGAEVGDVIVWIGGAGADRVLSFFATQKAGFAFGTPITQMGKDYVRDYLKVCDPKLIIVEDGWRTFLPDNPEAPVLPYRPNPTRMHTPEYAPVANDVISHLSFTSGSTGMPKGSPRDRAAMAYFIRQACEMQELGQDDTVALLGNFWNPTLFTGLYSGARTVCFDTPRHGAASLSEWLTTERATAFMAYPAIFRQIMATGRPLPDLRNIILIGEPLTRADAVAHARCTAPDAVLMNIYGSMEFAYVLVFQRKASDPINFDLMPLGAPASPGIMRLIDPEGIEITEDGVAGEIQVISPHVVIGYLNEPELTADRFHIRPDGVRTMKTGDLAYRDHAGVYHSMGRRDGQTKIRGYNVRPPEIEIIVEAVDGVEEATVGAFLSPAGIARLVCHYTGEASIDSLKSALNQSLPSYMVPSLWICLDELPKTGTGKVRRTALENPLSHRAPLSDSGWTPVEQEIGKLFSETLGIGDISLEDDFFDLGGDSLQAMRLIIELESAFGRRLAFEKFILDGASVSSLAQTITKTNAPFTVLRKGTTGRTLAISHTLGGHLAYFLEAAHMFSPDFRIIGANASGMASNERFASTYKDLATDTINRPGEELDGERAPIFLGYSFGGPLALESARLFAQANQVAPPLVLIDPLIQWHGRWSELRASFNQAKRGNLKTAASYLGRVFTPVSGARHSLDDAHMQAWRSYRPQGFDGSSTLIIRTDRDFSKRSANRWAKLIQGDTVIEIAPGVHEDMMIGQNASQIAQIIQKWAASLG